jgi:hypothetical protein
MCVTVRGNRMQVVRESLDWLKGTKQGFMLWTERTKVGETEFKHELL